MWPFLTATPVSGLRPEGCAFGVSGYEARGLGVEGWGLGFRVLVVRSEDGSGFGVLISGFGVLVPDFWGLVSGNGVLVSGSGVLVSGFGVLVSGFGFSVSGCGVLFLVSKFWFGDGADRLAVLDGLDVRRLELHRGPPLHLVSGSNLRESFLRRVYINEIYCMI